NRHQSTDGIIKRNSENTTLLDSGDDTANKTSITVLTGVLSFATTCSSLVPYTALFRSQGPASTPTSFTTQPAPNRPPQAPTNLSPPDGSANQPLTLILQASAFSAPDGNSHESRQWILKRSSDNTTVLDSGNDTGHKTSLSVPAGV